MKNLILIVFLAITTWAQAKTFKNSFTEIELPPNWDCKQEELDWVCQSNDAQERSEAIMVIVNKEANAVDDNLPKYLEVLKEIRAMRNLDGTPYNSEIRYTKELNLGGQVWADSLQLGPEIPKFYTRYLASVKDQKVAVLVTYSIADSVYPKWAQVMDRSVESLKIFFDPAAYKNLVKQSPSSLLSSRRKSLGREAAPVAENTPAQDTSGGLSFEIILGALLVLGGGAFWYFKKKQGS